MTAKLLTIDHELNSTISKMFLERYSEEVHGQAVAQDNYQRGRATFIVLKDTGGVRDWYLYTPTDYQTAIEMVRKRYYNNVELRVYKNDLPVSG